MPMNPSVWWTQPPFMEPPPKTQPPNPHPLISQFSDHRSTAAPPPLFTFNLNQQDDELGPEIDEMDTEIPTKPQSMTSQLDQFYDKEPMFEKPLTPSDVGKLNRLVIPKQHAEKYFPLGGSDSAGLLLSFEDESGKCWRFRYSYWNSSQSYVLTKGWSRFVKEKRLDAGDVVLFERHRVDGDRLFIGWRRRPAAVGADGGAVAGNSGGGWAPVCYSAHAYPVHTNPAPGAATPYQPDCLHAGAQNQTTPSGNNSKKLLRLFGVNLECQQPDESEPSTPDGSSTSSQGQPLYHYCTNPHPSNSPRDMAQEINFSRGVNQMRYHQG